MDLEKYVKSHHAVKCVAIRQGPGFPSLQVKTHLVAFFVCLFVCLCFFYKNFGEGFCFWKTLWVPFWGYEKAEIRGVGKEGKGVPSMRKVISVRLTPWCEGIIGRKPHVR
jgi:hypothetical protein